MFFGCASMLTHGTISGVRYLSIVHPHRFDWQSRGFVLGLLGINISVAAFFALAPIIGWGRYETFEFGCTLAFHDHSTNVRSYVITALLGVLFIPFAVCLFCYGRITYTAYMCKLQLFRVTTVPSTVKETNPMSTEANPVVKEGNLVDTEGHLIDMETPMMANQTDSMTNINQNANNKKEMEYRPNTFVRQDTHIKREMEYKPTAYAMVDKKLTRLMALTACGYIVAWTPFAMLGIWETFSPPKTIPTQFRVVASLFCKSATAYNPFIYFFMSQGFRADTKAVFQRVISGASSRELDYPHGSSSWTTTSRRLRRNDTKSSLAESIRRSSRSSRYEKRNDHRISLINKEFEINPLERLYDNKIHGTEPKVHGHPEPSSEQQRLRRLKSLPMVGGGPKVHFHRLHSLPIGSKPISEFSEDLHILWESFSKNRPGLEERRSGIGVRPSSIELGKVMSGIRLAISVQFAKSQSLNSLKRIAHLGICAVTHADGTKKAVDGIEEIEVISGNAATADDDRSKAVERLEENRVSQAEAYRSI